MKRGLFVIIGLLLLGLLTPAVSQVEAQEMTTQYYLIPVQVVQIDTQTYRGPSYLRWRWNPTGLAVQWSCKDYGMIDQMICAVDAEPADHAWLAGQANVYQFPSDLDTRPAPAQLSALQTRLEAAYIPGDWLSPSDTWRVNARTVTAMFLFMQRLTAITGTSPLQWGVTRNTQYRNVDAVYQVAISQAFIDLGYDNSVIRANWTLRIILKNAADQWGARPIYFGFTTL